MTRRAVKRFQEADFVFYERAADAEILELARRDAERVHVGEMPRAAPWPQARIGALIASNVKRGHRVVLLRPGADAGRAGVIGALCEAGLDVEIVPGVAAVEAAPQPVREAPIAASSQARADGAPLRAQG